MRQINSSVFCDALESAFKNVLSLSDVKKYESDEHICGLGETVAAAIDFSGDFSGCLSMVLKETEVFPAAVIILKSFSMNQYPDSFSGMFSEVLNIIAGNLSTELSKLDKHISLSPPHKTINNFDVNFVYSVILGSGNVRFKFCLGNRKGYDIT